jgi:hypothetical protein
VEALNIYDYMWTQRKQTSCMDRRNVVAMVAWLVAMAGLARFFRRFLRAVER